MPLQSTACPNAEKSLTVNRRNSKPVPVIDLFAGPGGLGEGFSSLRSRDTDERIFKIGLSIEKDAVAHATLRLRSFFRAFDAQQVPDEYYQLLAGKISVQELLARKEFAEQAQTSSTEALQAEMGKVPDSFIDAAIERTLTALGSAPWVLIGGPPCQAFSLAGRSTNESRVGKRARQRPASSTIQGVSSSYRAISARCFCDGKCQRDIVFTI